MTNLAEVYQPHAAVVARLSVTKKEDKKKMQSELAKLLVTLKVIDEQLKSAPKGKEGKPANAPKYMENFILAMMKAVSKDQSTLSETQIVDAKTTMLATTVESNIYWYWNDSPQSPLKEDEYYIKWYADHMDKKNQEKFSKEVEGWNAKFGVDSAKAQGVESQQDGEVQSAQGQTSSDASNLQMKVQMVQGLNGIMSALSGMLGKIIG